MNNLAKRLILAALGMVLVLGWWTIRERHESGSTQSSSTIPSQVWEGGAGTVTIQVESTDPATLRAFFESAEKSGAGTPNRSLQTWEKVEAGPHSWTISVPAATSGTLEFEAIAPKPGSKLSWTVRSGEKQIAQDTQTLTQPLQANEAFFLQLELDDFATGKLQEEN